MWAMMLNRRSGGCSFRSSPLGKAFGDSAVSCSIRNDDDNDDGVLGSDVQLIRTCNLDGSRKEDRGTIRMEPKTDDG